MRKKVNSTGAEKVTCSPSEENLFNLQQTAGCDSHHRGSRSGFTQC